MSRQALLLLAFLPLLGCPLRRERRETPPSDSAAAAPAATSVPAAAPIQVAAKQLYADYHANEVAADEKYRDKRILMTDGRIASIDKDVGGGMIVQYQCANETQTILASLRDSEKAKAAQLTKGTIKPILCRGAGMLIDSPSLTDCVLPDAPTPSPSTIKKR
jgi:hypothetical protein